MFSHSLLNRYSRVWDGLGARGCGAAALSFGWASGSGFPVVDSGPFGACVLRGMVCAWRLGGLLRPPKRICANPAKRANFSRRFRPFIGPAAFSSWGRRPRGVPARGVLLLRVSLCVLGVLCVALLLGGARESGPLVEGAVSLGASLVVCRSGRARKMAVNVQ